MKSVLIVREALILLLLDSVLECWTKAVSCPNCRTSYTNRHQRKRDANFGADDDEQRLVAMDEDELLNEQKCNSETLRMVMQQNMLDSNVKDAKSKIMRAAESTIGGHFNVICSDDDFSYITTTRLYCLQTVQQIHCYAFLTELSSEEVI